MENKVGIVIVTYNTAALIVKQVECIRKFCKDIHDIIIVDNSTEQSAIDAIQYYNQSLGCQYFKTNASSRNGSESHAFACNLAYNKLKDEYKYLFYIDHDNFPVKDFSIVEILNDKVIAGLGQGGKEKDYFWAGCVMFDNSQVDHADIDFSTNKQYRLDTGGNLYKVIDKYGRDKCVFFNESYHQNPQFTETFYNFYSMINNETFMHFVNSSNWNKIEKQEERINSLLNILEEKIK